jgi:hypothetical protein
MKRLTLGSAALLVAAFSAGFFSHFFYQRWTFPVPLTQSHPVVYSPLAPPPAGSPEVHRVRAGDVAAIKELAGKRAIVRGRVYRVGHSAKSDTYFLNFGPARSAFTGVIFASALEQFQKRKIDPKSYDGKDVELSGEIRDHPQYGLEMILEDPSQIRVLD